MLCLPVEDLFYPLVGSIRRNHSLSPWRQNAAKAGVAQPNPTKMRFLLPPSLPGVEVCLARRRYFGEDLGC